MNNINVNDISLDNRTINAKINQVGKTGKTFIEAVHIAGCHVVAKILDEIKNDAMPNVNRVRALILNMPRGTRRQAFAEWIKLTLPITITFNADNSDLSVKMLTGKAAKTFEGKGLEWACANVFEDVVKPERQPVPFKPLARIQKWMKDTQKGLRGEKDMVLPDGADEDLVARLIAANEAVLKDAGLIEA